MTVSLGTLLLTDLNCMSRLKISHLNICRLTHKINQLRADLPRSGFDVFTTSETWLDRTVDDRLTTMPGYDCIRAERKAKQLLNRPKWIVV